MALENNGGTPNPGSVSGAGDGIAGGQPNTGTGPISGGNPPAQGTQAARKFEYNEDRTDWTPRHRLNEESGKRTAAEQRVAALEAQLASEQKRTRALAGVEPTDPKAAEQQEVDRRRPGRPAKLGATADCANGPG